MNEITHEERGRRGGIVQSDKKKFAGLLRKGSETKCKNCAVQCYLRDNLLKINPEITCQIPFSRAKAVMENTAILEYSPEVLENSAFDLLDYYKYRAMVEPTDRNINRLRAVVLQIKQYFYPATQKSISININTFQEQLDNWRKARAQIYVDDATRNT
mgnify:CR=1 FL=1